MSKIFIYLFQITQIALLIFDKILVFIFAKNFNYFDIFLSNSIIKFLKYTKINNYFTKLIND